MQSETRSGSRQWRKPTNPRKQEDRSKPVRKKKTWPKVWRNRSGNSCSASPGDLDLLPGFAEKNLLVGGLEHLDYFSIYILGMSLSQLTNPIIFQRGRAQPPTRQIWKTMIYPVKIWWFCTTNIFQRGGSTTNQLIELPPSPDENVGQIDPSQSDDRKTPHKIFGSSSVIPHEPRFVIGNFRNR